MGHFVAGLLECQLLVMKPLIAGPLQALDRLQRRLNRQGLDAFEHLLRYQTISFQSTEANATTRRDASMLKMAPSLPSQTEPNMRSKPGR